MIVAVSGPPKISVHGGLGGHRLEVGGGETLRAGAVHLGFTGDGPGARCFTALLAVDVEGHLQAGPGCARRLLVIGVGATAGGRKRRARDRQSCGRADQRPKNWPTRPLIVPRFSR